jgi:uncharacterized protein DUF4262
VTRLQKNIENDVQRCGRSVLCIRGEEDSPPFAYTIGNWLIGLPELLMIGIIQGALLNDLSQKMIARGTAFSDSEVVSLGGKFPVKIVTADERAQRDYTFQASWYHGTEDYVVQQILAPDRSGRFPDDPACQPPYSTVPLLNRRTH